MNARLLLVLTLLLAGAACDQRRRDWSVCNGEVRTCKEGFACNVVLGRCLEAKADASADATAVIMVDAGVDAAVDTRPIDTAPSCTTGDDTLCAGNPAAPTCVRGVCGKCTVNGDCPAGRAICDGGSGRCVACLRSKDCPAATPVCSGEKVCGKCTPMGPNEACKERGATPFCEATTGQCAECITSKDCTTDEGKPICAAGKCVGCKGTPAEACSMRDSGKPACDEGSGRCVACTAATSCSDPKAPICVMNACTRCTRDEQCVSRFGKDPGVCLPDGRCATDAIYVQQLAGSCAFTPGPDAGTLKRPFCSPRAAVEAVTADKRLIVLRGAVGQLPVNRMGLQLLVVGQERASIEAGAEPGVLLTNGDLTIRNLAIRLSMVGVLAEKGTTLRMDRVVVEGNSRGGIELHDAAFDITNSVVAKNGAAESLMARSWGGILVEPRSAGVSPARLVNNTILGNRGPGVVCAAAITATANIASGNSAGDLGSGCAAVACCGGAAPGVGEDYRLAAGSPCIDAAPPMMSTLEDIDGESRAGAAAGKGPDCGADEYVKK